MRIFVVCGLDGISAVAWPIVIQRGVLTNRHSPRDRLLVVASLSMYSANVPCAFCSYLGCVPHSFIRELRREPVAVSGRLSGSSEQNLGIFRDHRVSQSSDHRNRKGPTKVSVVYLFSEKKK